MTTTSRPWSPSDRDRMIYRWVKFDGHKQSWVAQQLDLHQSTVSRIIDRYERWVAHGGPAQQGALTRDERLRAQRWLTYERNEWLLASAMRLAGEMEHMSDTSKSTTKHYRSQPSREVEVRTEDSIRDRTGTVCRYLRLAFRINMEQKKLAEENELAPLEPLTLDANEFSQALADSRSGFQSQNSPFVAADDQTLTRRASEDQSPSTSSPPPREADLSPSPAYAPTMPATHNSAPPQTPPTPASTITSVEIAPHKKPTAYACQVAANPPETMGPLDPILDVSAHETTPPIRILPVHLPLGAP